MLLRLNMFHLLQAVSPNSIGLDIGVPARGWTGEAYQGHIFWDELFIFPFLNYRMPEITRSLLMYRYRRLGEARAAAARRRVSGGDVSLAERKRRAGGDPGAQPESSLGALGARQLLSAAPRRTAPSPITSGSTFRSRTTSSFLQFHGAELILDIARFWSSIASFNDERGRYEIRGVMGPDEFHEGYPDAPRRPASTTTPIPTSWPCGCCAGRWRCSTCCPTSVAPSSLTRLQLVRRTRSRAGTTSVARCTCRFTTMGSSASSKATSSWRELDWEGYRTRYGNIQRLDLILEAENDSANRYKLSKQADVLMLFYLFSAEELGELFTRLGYPFEHETIPRNVAYYDARSSHGSTLVARRACLGAGAFRPAARDDLFCRSAAERCERHPARHDRGGRPPRRHGGHCRSGAARVHRYRSDRTMCCGSIRNCRRSLGASICAFAIAGIRSIYGSREMHSPFVDAKSAWLRSTWDSKTRCTNSLEAARGNSSWSEQIPGSEICDLIRDLPRDSASYSFYTARDCARHHRALQPASGADGEPPPAKNGINPT